MTLPRAPGLPCPQAAPSYFIAPFLDREVLFGSCGKELASPSRRKLVQATCRGWDRGPVMDRGPSILHPFVLMSYFQK